MGRTIVAELAVLLLAGCATPSVSGSGSIEKIAAAPSVSTPTPSVSTDSTMATCVDVRDYVTGKVEVTLNGWDTAADLFNARVGQELRVEATHLFGLESKATGAAATAIHDEAKGLVDVSIAIDGQDAVALGTAADAANSALANLQGACGF